MARKKKTPYSTTAGLSTAEYDSLHEYIVDDNGDLQPVEKVVGELMPVPTAKKVPGPQLANREAITDTKGNVVGVLTEQAEGSYAYMSLKPEIEWDARFPHRVLPDDIDASVWMRDPTIALGDQVSNNVRMGKDECDVCKRKMSYTSLALAVMTKPSDEPGPFQDFKSYGFYVECLDCCDAADTPKTPGATKLNTSTLGANNKNTSTQLGTVTTYQNWNQHCPQGHFELHTLTRNRGGLILSSWRGTEGGKIASNADYCIFFTDDWQVFWKPAVQLFPGTDGSPMPSAPTALGGPEKLPPCAILKWWDFTAPTQQVVEYAELAADLIRQGKRVQIGCFGGHGRTGTFAAIVDLKLGKHRTSADAIAWLHKDYCIEAIESKTQEEGVHAYAKSLGLGGGNAREDAGGGTAPTSDWANLDVEFTGDTDWSPNDS